MSSAHHWFLFVRIKESMQMFRVILVWEEALQASGLTSERKLFKFPVWWFFRIPSYLEPLTCLFLSFLQDIRKRDFPFFLESLVCFFPCADARSKSVCLIPLTSNLSFRRKAGQCSEFFQSERKPNRFPVWLPADGHNSLPLYKEAIRSTHPLCAPRSTPTCHFDVMARPRKFHRNFCRPADFRSAPTMSVSSSSYVNQKKWR